MEPLLSNQILMTLARTAVLKANYYISYTVADCLTGTNLTGVIINNSCFTLELSFVVGDSERTSLITQASSTAAWARTRPHSLKKI
jgi:hypothetical protein